MLCLHGVTFYAVYLAVQKMCKRNTFSTNWFQHQVFSQLYLFGTAFSKTSLLGYFLVEALVLFCLAVPTLSTELLRKVKLFPGLSRLMLPIDGH